MKGCSERQGTKVAIIGKNVAMKRKLGIFGKDVDIVGGKLPSSIIIYLIPLIFTNLFQSLYNAVDFIIVGNFSSTQAVAAVGATAALTNLFNALLNGISAGANVLFARYIGADDKDSVKKLVSTSFISSIAIGILFAACGMIFTYPLLKLTNCPENIVDDSAVYMLIFFLGIPAVSFYGFMSCILRCKGDSRRPLLYLLVSGVLNVVLNIIFVITFSMDVVGVAVATVISQYVSAIMLFVRLVKMDGVGKLEFRGISFSADMLRKIFRYGIPCAVANLAYAVSNTQITTVINGFGDVAVAGKSAANNLQNLFVGVFSSSMQAMTLAFVGGNLGAGDRARTLRVVKNCYVISVSVLTVMGIIGLVFHRPLLSLFVPESEEALAIASVANRFMMSASFIVALHGLGKSTLQAFGMNRYQMISSIISLCVFRAVWIAFVFPIFGTMEAVFIAYPLSWIMVVVIDGMKLIPTLLKYKKGKNYDI